MARIETVIPGKNFRLWRSLLHKMLKADIAKVNPGRTGRARVYDNREEQDRVITETLMQRWNKADISVEGRFFAVIPMQRKVKAVSLLQSRLKNVQAPRSRLKAVSRSLLHPTRGNVPHVSSCSRWLRSCVRRRRGLLCYMASSSWCYGTYQSPYSSTTSWPGTRTDTWHQGRNTAHGLNTAPGQQHGT